MTSGAGAVTLYPSYLSDAVGDLASGALSLLAGAAETRWAWADEPGEFRWVARREGDLLRIVILKFARTFSRELDRAGEQFLEAECDPTRFATQVRGQLQRLLNDWGESGYEREWGHPFPAAEHQRLTVLIQERRRGPSA